MTDGTRSITFINRTYPPLRGATGRLLRDLAETMGNEGWVVHVITTGALANTETYGNVTVHRIPAPTSKTVFNYTSILLRVTLKALTLPRTSLIVTMTDPPLLVIFGHTLSLVKKARHAHWCQDIYPALFPLVGVKLPLFLNNVIQKLCDYALRRTDKIIAIGRCMAQKIAQSGIDASRIAVIPNWADYETYETPAADTLTTATIGKPLFRDGDQKFRILYAGTVGRLHPILSVFQAAERLQTLERDIEFVFVTDAESQERLAKERSKRSLENVRLMPLQPNIKLRELMESGDMHLITLLPGAEALAVPSKIYSALAVARPILYVGPETSEVARTIKDYNAGATVRHGDAKALIEAIRAFRHDPDLWFQAHEGAQKASSVFTPAQSIRALTKRLTEIADKA